MPITISRKNWILSHKLNYLFGNAIAALIGSCVVVLLIAFAIKDTINFDSLLIWCGLACLVAVLRALLVLGYSKNPSIKLHLFWLGSYRVLNILSGLVIGGGNLFFLHQVSPIEQVIFLASTLGLTAAANATHSVDKQSFFAFMFSACLPSIYALLQLEDQAYLYLSIIFVLFVLVMLRTSKQARQTLIHNFDITYTLNYRATHDSLVDLANREEFENHYKTHTPQTKHNIAILFADLDNFKLLNDTRGHHVGDKALIEFSKIIKSAIRSDDLAARLGGDEFVVLLYLDSPEVAKNIANSILTGISEMQLEGCDHSLGTSIGIAYTEDTQTPYDTIMKAADLACYQSKSKGKNQYTMLKI